METSPSKDFQFEIFKEAIKKLPSNNIVLSPISLLFPLAILSKGAKGQTLSEFQKVLNDSENQNIYIENLNQIYNTIKVESCLKIANTVLTKVKINNTFIERGKKNDVKFDELKNVNQVNDWVKEKTNKKITKIIDNLDPSCVMVILNALYFHDNWKEKFDPKKTVLRPFQLSNQTTKNVNFMYHLFKDANYFENEKFQALKLLYNQTKITATIILPKPDVKINDLMLNMTTSNFFALFNNTNTADVELYLPKIKLENSYALNEILNILGLKEAFSSKADFSNLTNFKPIFINNVSQKTFLEIDENGTIAVAVTSIGLTLGLAYQKIRKVMKCDKPYLIFFTKYCPEIKKTLILFCAKIENP